MFETHRNRIEFTRGDTIPITVALTGYTMEDGDSLIFSISKEPNTSPALQVTATSNEFTLTAVQTKSLPVGPCCYEIELHTADGGVYTVVGIKNNNSPYNCVVLSEVTT